MSKQEAKQTRIVPRSKIPVAQIAVQLFNNATNLERPKVKPAGSFKSHTVYTATPRSSKCNSIKPIGSRILMSPIAEKRITRFSNTHININFSTVGLGSVQSAIVEPAASPICPFVFSESNQPSHSPVKEKMSNYPPPLGKRNLTKLSSKNNQGSNAKTVGKSDNRLERHQQMFKSRYAKKNRDNDGNVGRIRMNRRFDLLMKFREDQMAVGRVVM